VTSWAAAWYFMSYVFVNTVLFANLFKALFLENREHSLGQQLAQTSQASKTSAGSTTANYMNNANEAGPNLYRQSQNGMLVAIRR